MISAARQNEPIAIVGMSCRLPGANDPDELWQMAVDRREGLEEYPGGHDAGLTPELDAYYRRVGMPDGPASNRGGFLDGIDKFDAEFFEISPREAEWLDPQQRMLLETTWEALESAGIPPETLASAKTGVFVGVWNNDYQCHATANSGVAEFFLVTGGPLYGASSRIAYQFDLRGPDVSVNAACASSLVAVHLAVRALRSGECALALAGGVNAALRHEFNQALSRAKMLSPDGRCKFGDASADGFVRSDGVGLLVLKCLSDARRDGDNVLALIRGTAVCNDGRGSGLLATPSAAGQRQAMLGALADAGVDAETIDLVEAHGTGTRAGDPIEITAISSVFGRGPKDAELCRITSLKSNIGHAESAAGVASIIRTVQAMRHRWFPATLHVHAPNPAINWETIGLKLETEGTKWSAKGEAPLRAGVNGLGLTGTNAHVILESAPPAISVPAHLPDAFLLVISAASGPALRARVASFAVALEALQDRKPAKAELHDFCYTAAVRRSHLSHRLAVTGGDAGELREQLEQWLREPERSSAAYGVAAEQTPRIVFVFPGQGSQWVGMGRELLAGNSAFRAKMHELDEAVLQETGWSVIAQLTDVALEDRLSRIDIVQPMLFAVEVALAALWKAWGIVPTAVVGHSMGEIAAAHIAGFLTLDDAVAIICRRSRLLLRVAGTGAMVVVDLPRKEAQQKIVGFEHRVSIAVCNSPQSTVLAGDPATLNNIVADLERSDIFCRWVRVDVASHSPQMDPLREELASALAHIRPGPGVIAMQSTVHMRPLTGDQMGPDYWVANLRQPVLFADAVGRLVDQGSDTFLEMSPHPLLLPFIEQTGAEKAAGSVVGLIALGSLRREEPELAALLSTLGRLYAVGAAIDWRGLYPVGNLVALPSYPWQRERFWMASADAGKSSSFSGGHPLIGEAQHTAASDWIWTGAISRELHPWLMDHVVGGAALLPASAYVEIAGAVSRIIFGGAAAVVEDLMLSQAAVLPQGGMLHVQVIAAFESQDVYAFRFFCRDSVAAEWSQVASAQLRKQGAASPISRASLGSWHDAEFADGAIGGPEHSGRMAELGYSFGPSFCKISWLTLDKERGLAQISVGGTRSESYLLHPVLLDAALQLLGRLLLERSENPQILLPVSCERAEWFDKPEAGTLYAGATALPDGLSGEVEIFDCDGQLVLRLSGFAFAPLAQDSAESAEELMFNMLWEPMDSSIVTEPSSAGSDWVLVAQDLNDVRPLAKALEHYGISATIIEPPHLSPRMLKAGRPHDVVWFCGALSQGGHSSALAAVLEQMNQLAQFIAANDLLEGGLSQTRLCIITRGSQSAESERAPSIFEAGLWGFIASAQNEYPQLKTLCLDLPEHALETEAASVAAVLLRGGGEARIALIPSGAHVARLTSSRSSEHQGGLIPATILRSYPDGTIEGFDLVHTVPGSIDSFQLNSSWTLPPGEDEVQIEVTAACLNFRDVLCVIGLNEALSSPQIGGECSGVVLRVGASVTRFVPGDEVLAMTPSFRAKGMLASHANVPEMLVAKKPAAMSFAEASGIPCVFVTAWYSLVKLARLQRGERVLIHAAAGGVGLAAIQIARWIGAEIYATVGSQEKREYLRGLGVTRIMSSRTLDFTKEILDATGGEGVDVVLNSLAGPAIAAGLNALAPYGRFVEIGKRDIWENSRIGLKPFLKNLSLYAVDLSQTVEDRRPLIGSMLTEIMEHMASGNLSPVKTEIFPVTAASEAFQIMAKAAHIGKIAIDIRDPNARVKRDKSKLDPSAAYLITGGTGALGIATADTLVQHGARHLVLTARRGPSESAQQAIGELERGGASVLLRQMDVGVEAEVAALFEEIGSNLPRLAGIVHAAGVLDDAVVAHLTPANFECVTRGKVGGAIAMDACLKYLNLDFLIYYSSAAGILGNPGQANYAAANTMLDALAHNQRARGIPAISVDWGSWSEVGLAAASEDRGTRMATQGLRPISRKMGAKLLMHALASDAMETPAAQVAAMRFDASVWCKSHPAAARSHLFDRLLHGSGVSSTTSDDFVGGLLRLDSVERPLKLQQWLRDQIGAVLRLGAERIPDEKPLRALGLDSLMALELRNRLERMLPIKLSATFVWNYPTLRAIAGYLAARLDLDQRDQLRPAARFVPSVTDPSGDQPLQSAAELLEAELAGTDIAQPRAGG